MGESRGIGVACPACAHPESRVTDTRHRTGYVRRRRTCLQCDEAFTTKEVVVATRRGSVRTADEDALDHVMELVPDIDALITRLASMRNALLGPTDAPEAPPT